MSPDPNADRPASTGRRILSTGSDAFALLVGLVGEGRDAVARTVGDVSRALPAGSVRGAVDQARTRGHDTLAHARSEAGAWLRATAAVPVKWAEQTAIPKVVDDMTPYLTDEMMPKMLDAILPRIRTTVVPAIIEDLTTDPRIRTMITEQSSSAVAAAADELRQVAATADDNLEAAFRRTFVRRTPA